jgi:hypothetical protein
MINTKSKLNLKQQILTIFMVFSMVFSLSFTTLAAGTNPLNYVSTNTCTISGSTSSNYNPIDGGIAASGSQHIVLVFDKNVVSDAVYNGETVYAHNQGAIHLRDLTTSTDLPISVYRLGDGSSTNPEKQHIFFDADLTSGDDYEITVDADFIANNGLTLTGGTKYIDFTAQ